MSYCSLLSFVAETFCVDPLEILMNKAKIEPTMVEPIIAQLLDKSAFLESRLILANKRAHEPWFALFHEWPACRNKQNNIFMGNLCQYTTDPYLFSKHKTLVKSMLNRSRYGTCDGVFEVRLPYCLRWKETVTIKTNYNFTCKLLVFQWKSRVDV